MSVPVWNSEKYSGFGGFRQGRRSPNCKMIFMSVYLSLVKKLHKTTVSQALRVLKNTFGFDAFRPIQESVIEGLIAGEDQFVLMPTGGGKSLCYQVPALVRDGLAIIVSPLISLMQDQVNALCANGVKAAFYNSALTEREAKQTLAQLHHNELDLLYIAPERLMTPAFLERLQDVPISLIAIDEAHCVSSWGHDFRPEYLTLGALRQERIFQNVPMIALTATADQQTRADIVKRLHLQKATHHIASFNRPNIRYTVLEKQKPLNQILAFLKTHTGECGIVYCLSRKRVEEVAKKLQQQGFSALPYHAGMSTKDRQQTQDAFSKDEVEIIVATIAFGMGIDKPNVRFVIHYDLPKHLEGYYQETGRAGRDGLPAEALLLYGLQDIALIKSLIENSENQEQKRIESHKLNCMIAFAEAQTCRRRVLLNYFSESMQKDCGNCDVCLNPPETYDASHDAQIALSCVYRLGQRFGAHYVIEVLRGAETERIKQLHHNTLSTYGLGKHLTQEAWYSLFRQLIHRGLLNQDIANYSVLTLTDLARPVLRGEETLILAKPRMKAPSVKKTKEKRAAITDYDKDLFEKLRALRKSLATEAGVPPFVIFGDVTLIEMAAKLPRTKEEFLEISGVGLKKLESFGEAFLEVIQTS